MVVYQHSLSVWGKDVLRRQIKNWDWGHHGKDQPPQNNIIEQIYGIAQDLQIWKKWRSENLVDFSPKLAYRFLDRRMTLTAWDSWSSGARYYPLPEGHFSDVTPSEKEAERSRWKLSHSSLVVAKSRETLSARAHPTVALHGQTARQKNYVILIWQQLPHTLRRIILSCFCNGWCHTKQRAILIWRCKSIRP